MKPPSSPLQHLGLSVLCIVAVLVCSPIPEFVYRNDGYRKRYFQTYQLSVRAGFGFSSDWFNYWPEGNYPSEMYGGRVERIGAWAYVHE